MRKLLRNKLFVSLLSLLGVALVAKDLIRRSPPADFAVMARASEATSAAADLDGQMEGSLLIESRMRAEPRLFPIGVLRRDPFVAWHPIEVEEGPSVFRPLAASDRPPVDRLSLQAISIDADRASAVINHRVVRAGDVVDEFTIESISSEEVIVKHPRGIEHLRIRSLRNSSAPALAPPRFNNL